MVPTEPQPQTSRSGDPSAPVLYPPRRGDDEVLEYLGALRVIEARLTRCFADLSEEPSEEPKRR